MHILSLVILLALRFHSIHISYASAEANGSTVHFKVSYYKDDFLKAVDNWYGGKTSSFSPETLRAAEIEYLRNYLRLWSGRQFSHQLALSSYTITEDGLSIIFETNFTSDIPITQLSIDHRVICKEYSVQTNILTLKIFGSEKNIITTQSKPSVTITNN